MTSLIRSRLTFFGKVVDVFRGKISECVGEWIRLTVTGRVRE